MYFNLDKAGRPNNKGVWIIDPSIEDLKYLFNFLYDLNFEVQEHCDYEHVICIFHLKDEHPVVSFELEESVDFNEEDCDEYMTVNQFIRTYKAYRKEKTLDEKVSSILISN